MTSLTDTSPEARKVLDEVYRQMPVARKWLIMGELFRDAKALHAAGVRYRNPAATDEEIHSKWMETHYGIKVPITGRRPAMNPATENLRGLREVLAVFDSLGIPYALGGSMASSVFGIDRYTRDADITVEPFGGQESELAHAFGPEYYVSLEAIQDAIRDRSTFNIINTSTGFKVDVFVLKDQEFEKSAMKRRLALDLPDSPSRPLYFHSPEDVILFKLRWFRMGDETSDQQWSDVLGILKVQANNLDYCYLEQWATGLKISDLLSKARQETGIS